MLDLFWKVCGMTSIIFQISLLPVYINSTSSLSSSFGNSVTPYVNDFFWMDNRTSCLQILKQVIAFFSLDQSRHKLEQPAEKIYPKVHKLSTNNWKYLYFIKNISLSRISNEQIIWLIFQLGFMGQCWVGLWLLLNLLQNSSK